MRNLLTSLCLFPFLMAGAQVQFSSLSFEKACRQAGREKKVVMVVMESAQCSQCNEVAQRGLNQPEAFAINAMAIPLLMKVGTAAHQQLFDTYFRTPDGFGVLFFNAEGRLIQRWSQSTTAGQEYVTQTTMAYKKRNQPLPNISELEQQVQADPTNAAAVLALYKTQMDLGVQPVQMANDYARATTPAWQDSATIIRTLFQLHPILGTYADSMMRFVSPSLFNKLWYAMPIPERVNINRIIIARTGTQAVAEKNVAMARRNAAFAASILTNAKPAERQRAYYTQMATYHKNVHDSLAYFSTIETLMVQYFMRLNADSVRGADSAQGLQLLRMQQPMVRIDSAMGIGTMSATASFAPQAQFISRQMNAYCWDIYTMKPNSRWAVKAIDWAAHGLRIHESAELYDTYARLLYINDRKEEAIAAQEKAIAIAQQKQQLSAANFIKVLNAMKANQPLKDLE